MVIVHRLLQLQHRFYPMAFYSQLIFLLLDKKYVWYKLIAIPSFGIRKELNMENTQVDLDLIAEYKVPETPPLSLEKTKVIFDLTSHRKSNTESLNFQSKFN